MNKNMDIKKIVKLNSKVAELLIKNIENYCKMQMQLLLDYKNISFNDWLDCHYTAHKNEAIKTEADFLALAENVNTLLVEMDDKITLLKEIKKKLSGV